MTQKTFWKIQYIDLCIFEFAHKYKLPPHFAYNYLKEYKGLDYLDEHYNYEHTQAMCETQKALRIICRRNGGTL